MNAHAERVKHVWQPEAYCVFSQRREILGGNTRHETRTSAVELKKFWDTPRRTLGPEQRGYGDSLRAILQN